MFCLSMSVFLEKYPINNSGMVMTTEDVYFDYI